MGINLDVMQQIRQALATAPHGHKTTTMQRWAVLVGLTPQTLYRELDLGAKTRSAAVKRPELREWAKVVAMVKKRPPEEAGEISTDQAVRIAIESKLVPVSAMDVSPATFDRVMREMGTAKKSVRANRFQAKEPNQAHHFDASSSAFFYVAKRMPDGEFVLRMHRPAAGDYKNKPVPVDKLRPWYYGLCDDHSGRKIARLIVGQGENAADSILSIAEFWRVFGVPKKLLADQGMLKKCLATSGFIHACGVSFPQMMPYAKRGHGKIENPWKTQWQRFEKPFYAADDWQHYEITATEMNRRLDNYMEEENQRAHRFERGITRMDAWRRVMLSGGIVTLPEDALSRAHTMDRRKVGIDGLVHLDNGLYEVKGLHDAWAFVYRSMFEDKMVAEDCETGERYEVKDFAPLDEGEYRAHVDTAHQRAVKDGAALTIPESALPFQSTPCAPASGGYGAGKVVRLPIRETVREVADVFDVTCHADVETAMSEFHDIVGPVDAEVRDVVMAAFMENGLDKCFVREMAMEMRGEVERRRAAI
jgi:hypothetical protein